MFIGIYTHEYRLSLFHDDARIIKYKIIAEAHDLVLLSLTSSYKKRETPGTVSSVIGVSLYYAAYPIYLSIISDNSM